MAKNKGIIFNNGAEIRLHNKRFGFTEKDGSIICDFYFADSEPNKPAVSHHCIRGKIRVTKIKISVEAMDVLMMSWLRYKNHTKSLRK